MIKSKTVEKIKGLFSDESEPNFKVITFNFQGLKSKKGLELITKSKTLNSVNTLALFTIEPTFNNDFKYLVWGDWVRKYTNEHIFYAKNITEVYKFIKKNTQ